MAAGGLRLSDIRVLGEDILWVEGRPAEGGRCAVMRRRPGGRCEELLPPELSARSAVHEYGGGALAIASGHIIVTNQADQRLYRIEPGAEPRPLTAEGPLRHADGAVLPGGALAVVVEDHSTQPPVNRLDLIAEDGARRVLVSDRDFYASPRPSPDGSRLAWLQWDHPLMPWDGAELWTGEITPEGIADAHHVAGGPTESVFQPEWSPDGVLHLVTDRTGWWNLHRVTGGTIEPVAPMEAECGRPLWVLGLSTYAFCDGGRIALCACRDGSWSLEVVDGQTRARTPLPLPFTDLGRYVRSAGRAVVLDAGGPHLPTSIVRVDLDTGAHEVIRRSSDISLDPDRVSLPETVHFPTRDGSRGQAFLHRPAPPEGVEADPAEPPPLLVHAHGGPTSAAGTALDPAIQYWTTRGFAVLDVNYAGSTGHGRAYRERLAGLWGVADVADCVDAAAHVAQRGDADPHRLLITGGSAGGYVVLCALAFHDVFAAGASHYGIGDTESLARETHKFEARYLDRLIGPYPEQRRLYRQRSPLHHAGAVRGAVILFQGEEDPIVPPEQARTMFEAVAAHGVPCALLSFPGEQHGFRRQETISRVLQAELFFHLRILGLEPPPGLEPVAITNL